MEACQNPDILKVILYVKLILNIVFIIVPIGLILMIGIDFAKNVMAGKEEDMKKNLSIAIKRIIYCVCIFFVPAIVSLMNSVLDDLGVDYVECITNATSETIDDLTYQNAKTALDTAKSENTMSAVLEAETAIGKISDEATKSSMESELETIKQGIIDEEKNKQEEEDEKNKVSSGSSSGSSGSSSNSSTHLSSGTEGDYFAPIQGVTFSVGSYGSTGGCSNNVYHDLSGVAEGTPIYAGIDGTAKFMQTTSSKVVSGKTVLTSYGNQVRITASNGTYIIYAHLQKFVDGVNAPITETCPKKSDGSAPCSASKYASSTTTTDTKEVKKGDLIGYVGNTGNSTGTHLHVEIHEKGSSYCRTDPWKAFGMR